MEKINLEQIDKKFSSPEEEINFLRQKLTEKESLLKSEKKESYEIREEIDNTINSYKKNKPEDVYQKGAYIPEKFREEIVLDLAPENHDYKMSELIEIAQTKGISNAINIAEKMEDPHINDDFHRFLIQYIASGYQVAGYKEKTPLAKSLNKVLFEITLPKNKDEEAGNDLAKIVALMDHFYLGMQSVSKKDSGDSFSIEITNAIGSREFVFYIAVPRNQVDLFEKQLLSVFPNAKVVEKKDDFNIFNHNGYAIGSYAKLSTVAAKPIKTYDQFTSDPLKVILNVFSKLDQENEGAALQVIIKPGNGFYEKKYMSALKKISKGESADEEMYARDTTTEKIVSTISSISSFFNSDSKKDEDKPKHVDNILMELVTKKVASPIVSVNIRLISSSDNLAKAESILSDLESAFNQFNNPTGNRIEFQKMKDRFRKDFFRKFIYREFDKDYELPLNINELSTIVHLPSQIENTTGQLKTSGFKIGPAPIELGKDGIILGTNEYQGRKTDIHFSGLDRARHMYVIGQTGTGKTNILKTMIIQDIKNGEGVCMIDPHGSDIQDILANVPQSRIEDVIYFDPSYVDRPIALNMLEYDIRYPQQKIFVVNELFSIFMKLYGSNPESMGPMFEQYFRNATMLVLEDPETGNTLLDVSRVMADENFRKLKLSHCKNPVVKQFWEEIATKAGGEASLQNIVPYITSKFDVFLANDIMRPIIAQEKSSFNFREIMDKKKILLVNLSKGKLGDINSNLIGLILVGKILMASLSRSDILGTDFPPFYLYIDEFQNITTDSISTILSEARKYKLSLNVAHQFIAQLDQKIKDAVFGNVGSMAVFRVGSEDAQFLEKQFLPHFEAADLMNINNYNAYVKMLSNGVPVHPFSMRALKAEDGNKSMIDSIKQLSYLKYGRDKADVDREINLKYVKVSKEKEFGEGDFNNFI